MNPTPRRKIKQYINNLLNFKNFSDIINKYGFPKETNLSENIFDSFKSNLWNEFSLKYRGRYIYQPELFINDFITITQRNQKQLEILYKMWIYELGELEDALITKDINTSKDSLNTSGYQTTTFFNTLEEDEEGPSTERNYNISKSYRYSDAVLLNRGKSLKLQSGIKEFVNEFKTLFSLSVVFSVWNIAEQITSELYVTESNKITLKKNAIYDDLINYIANLDTFKRVGMFEEATYSYIACDLGLWSGEIYILQPNKPLYKYPIDRAILNGFIWKIEYEDSNG